MRCVSQTHRADLDWPCDRINLDPVIQINCVNTNQQIADILTRGSFSRVTPLLHTCSHLSVLFSSVQKDATISKQNAERITESATAKQRHVNLSTDVKVEKDTQTDWVVGVEHPSQTMQVGGNHQRLKGEPASSAASMEESTFCNCCSEQPYATAKQATSATHKRGVHNVPFPVNQAVWGIFTTNVCGAAPHLRKDERNFAAS